MTYSEYRIIPAETESADAVMMKYPVFTEAADRAANLIMRYAREVQTEDPFLARLARVERVGTTPYRETDVVSQEGGIRKDAQFKAPDEEIARVFSGLVKAGVGEFHRKLASLRLPGGGYPTGIIPFERGIDQVSQYFYPAFKGAISGQQRVQSVLNLAQSKA